MSKTRLLANIDSVKPMAAHLVALKVLEDLKLLNVTSEYRRHTGIGKNFKTFNCFLLASIWFNSLKLINIVNRVLKYKNGTIDFASKSLSSLVEDLKKLRNEGWDHILNETLVVAKHIDWSVDLEELKRIRKRKRLIDKENKNSVDNQKTLFRYEVFNIILDSVIGDLTIRFESVHSFCVLWLTKEMTINQVQKNFVALVTQYPKDLGNELTDELQSLKCIYLAIFGEKTLNMELNIKFNKRIVFLSSYFRTLFVIKS